MMKIKTKPFKRIDREYIILSSELRRALKLKGEIKNITLNTGRSPQQVEDGVSADTDTWCIETEEIPIQKQKKEKL